jgi:hypothetical protein
MEGKHTLSIYGRPPEVIIVGVMRFTMHHAVFAWLWLVIIAYYYRALAPILSPYAIHTGSIGVIATAPPSACLLVVVHVEGVGLQKKGTVASPAGTDRLLPSSACRYKKEISCRN